jgi:hypothetical protein
MDLHPYSDVVIQMEDLKQLGNVALLNLTNTTQMQEFDKCRQLSSEQ